MSETDEKLRILDGGDVEVVDAPEQKKKKAKAPKLADQPVDSVQEPTPVPQPPPPANGGKKFTPPHASAETGKRTKCTRRFLPRGFSDPDNVMLGGPIWYESVDLEFVLSRLAEEYGGGKWRLEFFQDSVSQGTRDEDITGEPLPILDEPPPRRGQGLAWHDPRDPRVIDPRVPPPNQQYHGPQTYIPPGPGFQGPPPTSREESLREELTRMRAERERERQRADEKEREAKIEAKFNRLEELVARALEAKSGPNPMDTWAATMQRQAEIDREREERKERDRIAREDKEREERKRSEEKERQERLRLEEREERRREEERREKKEREEREERLRAEERKERLEREDRDRIREEDRRREAQQREDRLAKEMREHLTAMTSKSPADTLLPVIELIDRLRTGGGDDDEDKEQGMAEQVVGAVTSLASGVGAVLQARNAPEEAPQPTNIGRVNATPAAPQIEQKNPDNEEAQLGRLVLLLKTVTDCYKGENEPEQATAALMGYAKSLEDQGHAGVTQELVALSQWAKVDKAAIVAGLTVAKANVTSQVQAGNIDGFIAVLNDAEGERWVRAVLTTLGGGA